MFSTPTAKMFGGLFGLVLLADMFPLVNGGLDSTICCLKAARAAWAPNSTLLPYMSCGFGTGYVPGTYGLGQTPQVTATLAFCKQNCGGLNLSTLTEWLPLVTSWVLPAIALLIICSTGECKEVKKKRIDKPKEHAPTWWYRTAQRINTYANRTYEWMPDAVEEFIAILGDPASAIRGAFSEIALDIRVVKGLTDSPGFDMIMKALAMVAGQTKFTSEVETRLTNVVIWQGLLIASEPFTSEPGMEDLRNCLKDFSKSSLVYNVRRIKDMKSEWRQPEEDIHLVTNALRSVFYCNEDQTKDVLWACLEAFRAFLETDEARVGVYKDLGDPDSHKPSRHTNFEEEKQQKVEQQKDEHQKPPPLHQRLKKALKDVLEPVVPEITYAPDNGANESINKGKELVKVSITEKKAPFQESKWAKGLGNGVKMAIKGRVDFTKALFLPVILSLAATAGSFYTAYGALGDNDTAHQLAYGIWYSWIIILAVASNCYIATANPGLARLALEHEIFLSEITVPLRDRAHNTREWMRWLDNMGARTKPANQKTPVYFLKRTVSWPLQPTLSILPEEAGWVDKTKVGARLIFKQFLGWVCVALPCACAASISYTTPTVGLGCRSFNHMLYGVCTLAISVVAVVREFLTVQKHWSALVFTRAIYIMFIGINTFILVFGTLFHLIGLYRTCICSVIGAHVNFLLDISSNTALDVANARKFWLPVGYMDFGIVWIICAICIGCRGYIHYHIKLFLDELDGKETEEKEEVLG
jgi:hypothetical protein